MVQTLTIDFSWNDKLMESFLPIILTLVAFIIYWFIAKSEKVKAVFYQHHNQDEASLRHITFTRIIGFLSMGVFPAIICLLLIPRYSLPAYGLMFRNETSLFSVLCILALAVIVIPTTYFNARKPKNLVNYPQVRAKTWTKRIVIIYTLSWVFYLFGYEFLFRGILLFPLVATLGTWPAISINVAIYSATHIPKGLEETIGAILLGLVLCILTLLSGTIWIAFVVHVIIALTNSFTALKFHPDMHFRNSTV